MSSITPELEDFMRNLVAVAVHVRDGLEKCTAKEDSALEYFLVERGVTIRSLNNLLEEMKEMGYVI